MVVIARSSELVVAENYVYQRAEHLPMFTILGLQSSRTNYLLLTFKIS